MRKDHKDIDYMIVFDLDGTLANCEHRRHFVDPTYRDDCYFLDWATLTQSRGWYYKDRFKMSEPLMAMKFEPDYRSFNEACDKDVPISQTLQILDEILQFSKCPITHKIIREVEIWSGRCESVMGKTISWLVSEGIFIDNNLKLKMRPVGDSTPDDELKERWLDEALAQGKTIDFVFDDRLKVCRMWNRRGIFVFNCNQDGREF